jgi:hypothetical protein
MVDGAASRLQAALQSTLLWGALCMFATIVLTVVAVMIHDFRWILALAWPFAAVAIWEFGRIIFSRKIVAAYLTGTATIVSGLLLLWLYFALAPSAILDNPPQPEQAKQVQPESPIQAPSLPPPQPSPAAPKLPSHKLQSTVGKMLLSCTIPPSDKKKRAEARNNFRKASKIYEETFGISMSLTEDGYKLDIEPKTQEGLVKMGAVSKVAIQTHRIGENVVVSYTWQMPGILGDVMAAVSLDADSEQTVQVIKQVEQLLGPTAQDKCKIL